MTTLPCPPLTGVVLAGGAGRRVDGADKAWLPWQGQSLFAHTLSRLSPQVTTIWVSANRDPARYAPWLDKGSVSAVLPDGQPDTPGPLAALASLLPRLCAHQPEAEWLLITPVDTPRLPTDLGERLWQGLQHAPVSARLAVAVAEAQPHWLHLLLHHSLVDDLQASVAAGEQRMHAWCRRHGVVEVDFPEPAAFANFNRWADFEAASGTQANPDSRD